jgi:hypothetical protein
MSVSAPRAQGTKNPAKKFIKYKGGGDQGYFEYYDSESKTNNRIELTDFVILDKDLFSITGFINATSSSIISNEVRTINDTLVVKSWKDKKGTIVLNGTYKDLKDTIKDSRDYKYTKCVYILFQGELCHLQLNGATFAAWLKDVEANNGHENSFISCVGHEDGKKGAVKYKYAVFEVGSEVDKATWNKMIEVDSNILQPYLEGYLKGGATGPSPTHEDSEPAGFDTKDWRGFASLDGTPLGALNRNAILELNQHLIEDGQEESELFANVGQAIYDYQQIQNTWGDKKNSEGKYIKDFTESELKEALTKVPQLHKARQLLEVAYENMFPKTSGSGFGDDDSEDIDIPF